MRFSHVLSALLIGSSACLLSACSSTQPTYSTLTLNPKEDAKLLAKHQDIAADVLFLQNEEKIAVFRNMEKIGPSRTVYAGETFLELPQQSQNLDAVTFSVDGNTFTATDYIDQQRVAGLIVIKDGNILYERYGLGNTENSRWVSFSVTKSVVSMLFGAAVKDGYIKSVDEKVTDYLPHLKGSPYDQTTIRNLLQMASGVAWDETYSSPDSDVAQASYETLALYDYLNKKERVANPGEKFNYNTAETNLAGTLLRSAIGNNLSDYLTQKIWQPFGMESDAQWRLTEAGGGEFGGCCISATLRDYARLGLFALANGQLADGTQILEKNWLKDSTAPSQGNPGYGYFWWLTGGEDVYQARGIFGQGIYINPNENIIIAIQSARKEAASRYDGKMQTVLFDALVKAVSN